MDRQTVKKRTIATTMDPVGTRTRWVREMEGIGEANEGGESEGERPGGGGRGAAPPQAEKP